jgi:RHS repeat-associated protein
VISSAWRADALRKSLTYPNGRVEVYTYDVLDRMKTVSDQGASQPIAIYDYMGVGRVLERLYPQNGTRETYLDNTGTVDVGYDGMRRPVEDRTLGAGNALVIGFTYTYDRMGNKLTEGKLHDPNNSETYTYDSAYRLITFNRAAGGITPAQTTWTLDGVGNWVSVNSETRQYSSTNELIQRNNGTSMTALTYDNNGNQTNDGTYQYTYDALNRLTSVTRDSDHAMIAVYSYDAIGRRIQMVVTNDGAQNGTTDYYLDGQQDIEEHNGSGALTQQYVYGPGIDEPLVLDRAGGQRLFYNQNALGSVYALTDTNGVVVEGYQYDAYGLQTVFDPGPGNIPVFSPGQTVTIGGTSQVGNPFLFTGQRLDPEDGLYYYRARQYDPAQGRFLQRDPAESATEGVALYSYVSDNPVNDVDPRGLAAPRLRRSMPAEPEQILSRRGRWLADVFIMNRRQKLCCEASATYELRNAPPGLYELTRRSRYLIWRCYENCAQTGCAEEEPVTDDRISVERFEIPARGPGGFARPVRLDLSLPSEGNRSCSSRGWQFISLWIRGRFDWGTHGNLHLRLRVDWDCCGADQQEVEWQPTYIEPR